MPPPPPVRGWITVTVPGAVAELGASMSERFGRLPFADLLQPAIEIAERGYAVPLVVAAQVGRHAAARGPARIRAGLPALRARAAGGETFRFDACGAHVASAIAQSAGGVLPVARSHSRWQRHARERGSGAMTATDFAAYAPEMGSRRWRRTTRRRPCTDSAQRAGHRGADGTRHPAALRSRRACRWTARVAATCRSRR